MKEKAQEYKKLNFFFKIKWSYVPKKEARRQKEIKQENKYKKKRKFFVRHYKDYISLR